ncbi:MAG: serine/threonine protein kinase [Nannocystis sp.]|nr:serine/threonine protein kinase [Nannocystis sp.]
MDGASLVALVASSGAGGAEGGWRLVMPPLVRPESKAQAPAAEPLAAASAPAASPAPALVGRSAAAPQVSSGARPARTMIAFGGAPPVESEVDAPRERAPHAEETIRAGVASSDAQGPRDLWIGRVIDQRYRIDGVLGSGGMGVVYRATHVMIDKPLAVKVLRPDLVSHSDVLGRFLREAQLASQVKHPNVVEISDYGRLDGNSAYYVMEHLSGQTLAQALAQGGRLAPERAISIAAQAARGLGAAHDRGIVHRDLKPDNIFLCVDADGREVVKLLDFGIARGINSARMTAQGVLVGTPAYMSPEQAQSVSVDGRSDLYALGVILFEMLSGRAPFGDKGAMETVNQHLFAAPPMLHEVAPTGPRLPAIERVIRALLAKDRDERPRRATAVIEALEAALTADLAGLSEAKGGAEQAAPAAGAWRADAASLESSASARRRALTVNLGSGSVVEALAHQSGSGAVVHEDALTIPRGDRRAVSVDPAELSEDPDAVRPRSVTPSGRIEKRPSVIVRRGTQVEHFAPPPRRPSAPPVLASQSSEALARERSRRSGPPMGLVLAVAMIVATAITLTIVRFWPRDRPSAAVSSAPPPASTEVTLRFESAPAGAAIFEGGTRLVGVTPATLEVPPSREGRVYVLRRDGYIEAVRTIVADRAQTIEVTLEAASAAIERASKEEGAASVAADTALGAAAAPAAVVRPTPRPQPRRERPADEAPSAGDPPDAAPTPASEPKASGSELGDLKDPFARGGGG